MRFQLQFIGATGQVTGSLCQIMLPDSGYLNEKDVQWENKNGATRASPMEHLAGDWWMVWTKTNHPYTLYMVSIERNVNWRKN